MLTQKYPDRALLLRLVGVVAVVHALVSIDCGTALAVKPSRVYQATPSTLAIAYDSLSVPTAKGQRLTAWLCHAATKQSDQLIVIAGPDAGNMSNELDLVQGITKNLGVDVLLFDYRGFGTSDPIAIDTDLIALPEFAEDLHSVIAYVSATLHRDSLKTIVYGRSMGAALAIGVASMYGGAGGVIAESPYVTQQKLQQYYDSVYVATGSSRRIKIAVTKSTLLEPLSSIRTLSCPVMIVHGSDEHQVTSREITDLYLECPSHSKSLWIAAGCGHLEVAYKQPGVFLNLLYTFLKDSGRVQ